MTIERPDHWPLKADPTRRDAGHWDAKGRLNADGVRELGRLVQEGCGSREMARTGMSQRAFSHRFKANRVGLTIVHSRGQDASGNGGLVESSFQS